MSTQQPEALPALIERFRGLHFDHAPDGWPAVRTREITALLARITELESQLAQRFDAADMATASAQGFRDGVASLSANAGEPRNAIDRDALIDAIAQGLRGTWHCTRVWEAWNVGTMSQDDFEPVDESETPTEIADAVLALLAAPPAAPAQPAAQQGAAYAALPTSSHAGSFLIGTCPLYTADKMRAFADATHTLRASHGQAPAQLAQRFDAADMATASAQGFRDGVASVSAGWISVDERLPEPGNPVLLDIGKKYPIRALWAAKNTVRVGTDVDDWGEYDEETDEYYCPEGWYEWNEHEEVHWAVSETPRAWRELPPPLPAAPGPADGESK